MFCLLALIIFSILGIFSASHRQLAKEAFDCVFRRITLRPCNTGFDKKIKSKIVGKLLNRSEFVAKLLNKHFEMVSWVFFIILLGSGLWVVKGGYNFYMYGSCNGLNASGFCAFDPTGENNKVSQISDSCSLNPPSESDLDLAAINLSEYPTKDAGSEDSLVFIGCYNCDYTRKAYPLIQKLQDNYEFNYTFVHFPVKDETSYISNYVYCGNLQDPEKLWRFNGKLFASSKEDVSNNGYVDKIAVEVGFDVDALQACVTSEETQKIVDNQFEQVRATGIYGTPTIFINDKALVGPKPYRVYQRMLGKFW
jgi:predicted DsbA family dithiol-disulfide isomerase